MLFISSFFLFFIQIKSSIAQCASSGSGVVIDGSVDAKGTLLDDFNMVTDAIGIKGILKEVVGKNMYNACENIPPASHAYTQTIIYIGLEFRVYIFAEATKNKLDYRILRRLVIAHEIGHTLQRLYPTSDKLNGLQEELISDYIAGMWLSHELENGLLFSKGVPYMEIFAKMLSDVNYSDSDHHGKYKERFGALVAGFTYNETKIHTYLNNWNSTNKKESINSARAILLKFDNFLDHSDPNGFKF
jgi:hypothetical protein